MYYTKIGNRKISIEDLKFYSTCPHSDHEKSLETQRFQGFFFSLRYGRKR